MRPVTGWSRSGGSSRRWCSTARRSVLSTRAGLACRSGASSGEMVPRIQPDELHELARTWGFSVESEEAEQLLVVAEAVFQAFDLLESQQPAFTAPVDAVREPGRPPAPGEDPLQAIVRSF